MCRGMQAIQPRDDITPELRDRLGGRYRPREIDASDHRHPPVVQTPQQQEREVHDSGRDDRREDGAHGAYTSGRSVGA